MISKVMRKGGSFDKTSQYLCQDQSRALVLDAEGVRIHDHKLMARDFEDQRRMRPQKEKAVFHTILSFHPSENPSDGLMVEIARKYLQGIGVTNTQYVVVRHIDKEHDHMHIMANLVNNKGQSIDTGWNYLKSKKVAQQLTREYGLVATQRKNLELTHRDRLTPSDNRRYQIYEIIRDSLPQSRDLADLEKRILKQAVNTRYHYPAGDSSREPDGISFSIDGESFQGCKIDREFSIKNLQHTLTEQLQQRLEHKLKNEPIPQHRHSHRMRHHF